MVWCFILLSAQYIDRRSFYLFCGWITSQRGDFKDHLKVAPRIKQEKAAMLTYFLIAMMMAGLPPFSGFLGKVFILQATVEASYQGWIIGVVLVVSLLSIIALTRVGFILFWRASLQKKIQSIQLIFFIVLCRNAHHRVTIKLSIYYWLV